MKSHKSFFFTFFAALASIVLFCGCTAPDSAILPQNSYHVTFTATPVKWDQIPAAADFCDYDKDHAKMLVEWDTAGKRNFEVSAAEKAGRKTQFRAAYGNDGIYFRIECEEPEMGKILSGQVKDGGSLEIFLVPGDKDEYYYMFMGDLAKEKIEEYTMFYRTEGYRPANEFYKADVGAGVQGWTVDIYLPYILFYSKLPLDGDSWRFNIVRWMPSYTKQGGVTWLGKVHDPGTYRNLIFDKPTKEQLLAIRRSIVRQAHARFVAQTDEIKTTYSTIDPYFYKEILEPVIKKHEASSAAVKDIDNATDETLFELSKNVPEWTDFRYKASELRKEYINDRLLNSAK